MSSNQIERLSKNKVQSNASMISFHGLQYQTKLGHKCQKEQKTILSDISGVFEPGLNAIMGPSGCGKTSLLDLLAKRRDVRRDEVSGQVLLNGREYPKYFNSLTG